MAHWHRTGGLVGLNNARPGKQKQSFNRYNKRSLLFTKHASTPTGSLLLLHATPGQALQSTFSTTSYPPDCSPPKAAEKNHLSPPRLLQVWSLVHNQPHRTTTSDNQRTMEHSRKIRAHMGLSPRRLSLASLFACTKPARIGAMCDTSILPASNSRHASVCTSALKGPSATTTTPSRGSTAGGG